MDAQMNMETLLVVVAILGCLANALALFSMRTSMELKRDRIENLDRRVTVLEERVAGIGEIKGRLLALSDSVAALNERSKSTLEMVHSIQEFLREQSNERS